MRNDHKTLLILGVTAFLAPAAEAAAAKCDQCMVPGVSLYDTKVSATQAAGSFADSLSNGLDFRDAAQSVRTFVDSLDPNRECMLILAGGFASRDDSAEYRIRGGIGFANTVVKDSVGLLDYMLHSEVSGTPGDYKATVSLEVSKTRELVAVASRSFASASDAAKATDSAVGGFGSVFTRIRDFEKKKRESGHPYAMAPIIRFAPATPLLALEASTGVEITMVDCDGVALANRTLTLSADGGTFAPASVTTDASGKAQSTFTAGKTVMVALLVADYSYTTPAGVASKVLANQGVVTIGGADDEIWQLTGTYRAWNTDEQVSDTKLAGMTDRSRVEGGNNVTIRLTALLNNISRRPSVAAPGVRFWSEPMEAKLRVSATGSDWSRSNKSIVTADGWTGGFDHSSSTGHYAPDPADVIESMDFHFVEDSTGADKGARYFDVEGIRLRYTGGSYTQASNSRDGITKSESEPQEGIGSIDFSISYAKTDAGYLKDTSYTEAKSKIRIHHEESVTRQGYQYFFSSRYNYYEFIEPSTGAIQMTEVQRHFSAFEGTMIPLSFLPHDPTSVKPIRSALAGPAVLSVALGKCSSIRFSLPTAAQASFQIVNQLGQVLASVPEASYGAGVQTIHPDLSMVGSGVGFLVARVHALDGSPDIRITRSVSGVR